MKIPLTQGKVALISDADFALVSRFSWCAVKRRGVWYAQSRVNGRLVYLHRLLTGFPSERVDHENGDGLDCRRDNLRIATASQNGANSRKHSAASSRYKGVCWDTSSKNWKASYTSQRKTKHLGRYPLEVSAALAYDRAAQAEWGDFANLNFPVLPVGPSNILIVGHGRGGKDTAADFLHGHGELRCAGSSSWFALPFISAALNRPPQKCWEERHNNRVFWFEFCNALRANDPLFLMRRALQSGNVVTGLRDRVEMDAAKSSGMFQSIVWVDRPGTPVDPTVKFTQEDCTDVIHNDGTLEEFREKVLGWAQVKGYIKK